MIPRVTRSDPSRAQWRRRLANRRHDKTAFVLSGGGPLGAMQVGALRATFEAGLRPDLIVGTSVGALNSAIVAFDPTLDGVTTLEKMWRTMTDGDLFPGGRFRASWARMLVRGDKIFENSGIKRIVQSRIGDARFEDAQMPLGVVATDLESGSEKVFTSGSLMDPLLASIAMPGIFPPVVIDGVKYTDGGVSNNVPLAPAVEMGATTVYVMNSTSHSHQRRPLTRPIDYLLHAFSLARSQRLSIEQAFYGGRVKLVILPTPPLDFFVPFASMEHTDRLIGLSYDHTSRFLSRGIEKLGEDGSVEAVKAVKAVAPGK